MPRSDEITPDQAAALVGVSVQMIRTYCRRGDLPARQVSGVWLIRRADAVKFRPRPAHRPRRSV